MLVATKFRFAGTAAVMVGLVKWPVTGSCTVDSATIVLRIISTSNQVYKLYPANRAWVDSQANWTNATSTQSWQVPGALGPADRGTSFKEFTPDSAVQMQLQLDATGIALVQTWINNPALNNGIIVGHETSADGFSFASFEYANSGLRPKLVYHCQ